MAPDVRRGLATPARAVLGSRYGRRRLESGLSALFPTGARLGSRGELSDLMWEMQGELGSSHAYEIGGEYRRHPEYTQGHLGIDWRLDAQTGRVVITRIVEGDPWDAEATSPLRTPGVNAKAGDAILAINGRAVSADVLPDQLLVNQAGREVQVLLQSSDGGEPRSVTVRAIGGQPRRALPGLGGEQSARGP